MEGNQPFSSGSETPPRVNYERKTSRQRSRDAKTKEAEDRVNREQNDGLVVLDRFLDGIEAKVGRPLTLPTFMALTAAVGFSLFKGMVVTHRALEDGLTQTLPPIPQPERPQRVQIDERFRELGIPPRELRRGVDAVFGPLLWRNVSGIEHYPGHRSMPLSYRGPSPFEAGHCVRSTRRGDPSHLVITIDAFGPNAEGTEGALQVLIHELAHALDAENADDMPEDIRAALRTQLQSLVAGDGATIYSYVNAYEGGSPTEEQESGIQREELFAELLSEALTMYPLPLNSSLRGLSFEDRMTKRLADNHNTTMEVTRPYARILVLVERWKGEGFIERGQIGFQRFSRDVVNHRVSYLRERALGDLRAKIDGREFFGVSAALEQWMNARRDPLLQRNMEVIDRVVARQAFGWAAQSSRYGFLGQEMVIQEEDRTHAVQRRYRLNAEMARSIENDRREYLQRYANRIPDPELQRIFLVAIGEVDEHVAGGAFEGLFGFMLRVKRLVEFTDVRELGRVRPSAFDATLEQAKELESLFTRASQRARDSHQDISAFRETLLAFIRDETQGVWYQQVAEKYPNIFEMDAELELLESQNLQRRVHDDSPES